MIAEELEYARRLLARARARGSYTWEPPGRVIPTAAWTEYRADFALVASEEEWTTVAAAFADFDQLNWHLVAVLEEEQWTNSGPQHPMESRVLDPKAQKLIPAAVQKIDAALELLHSLRVTSDVHGRDQLSATTGGTQQLPSPVRPDHRA